ncbi:hypothetical protein INR49_025833, partial [Caranx melampygus]
MEAAPSQFSPAIALPLPSLPPPPPLPPLLPPPSSSSSSSSVKPHSVEAREAEVRLLPPLLKDQAWGVHAQEAFLLFCLALGPSDVHIHWLINGHSLDTPIMEYRLPVGQREVLVSSWLREGPLIKDARYHCVAEASTGNDISMDSDTKHSQHVAPAGSHLAVMMNDAGTPAKPDEEMKL